MKSIFLTVIFFQMFSFGAVNEHFTCQATSFFGAVNAEIEQTSKQVRVTLSGHKIPKAVKDLGLDTKSGANKMVFNFPAEWCHVSKTTSTVMNCEIPDTRFPRPTLKAEVYDIVNGSLGDIELSVSKIAIERTSRTIATSTNDFEYKSNELFAYMISEKENTKRATLRLPYSLQDCQEK